jgi:hypothetical protein
MRIFPNSPLSATVVVFDNGVLVYHLPTGDLEFLRHEKNRLRKFQRFVMENTNASA